MWDRVLAVIVLLLSVLLAPFWLSVILGILGMFYFKVFWEAAVFGLLIDLAYGTSLDRYEGFTFVVFVGAVVLLLIIETLKRKTRLKKFYEN